MSLANAKMDTPTGREDVAVAHIFNVPDIIPSSKPEKVLGGVSLGLYGIGQDGNHKSYIQPCVTVGRFHSL